MMCLLAQTLQTLAVQETIAMQYKCCNLNALKYANDNGSCSPML
jgi:hypothetical protein